MMDGYREAYREEAGELVAGLEQSLLQLEEAPGDAEIVGRVFRALHTIKGSGAMFGFDDIAAFTHEIENAFDLVRDGKLAATRELISVTLAARDHIKALLNAGGERSAELEESGAAILRDLGALVAAAPAAAPEENSAPDAPSGARITYRVRFIPSAGCLLNGANPLLLLRELAELGACRVMARTDRLPDLRSLDPERCYLWWDAVLTTNRGQDAIRDVFIFLDAASEVSIEVADAGEETGVKRVGEILVDRGDVSEHEVETALSRRPLTGECLVDAGVATEQQVRSALVEQEHLRHVKQQGEPKEGINSIRVPAAKLDALVNIVGELVTVRARLTQLAAASGDAEMVFVAEEVERLTEKLRDTTMSVRMIPIAATFSRFRRVVRDLSRELGKDVELITEGGETELDKTVIEQIGDPLVHLIRNSLDHGIERPEAREAAGKPRKGRIHLSAAHSGASVLIRVSDDGAGLDREAIRRRAIERGLLAADEAAGDERIFSCILEPGFSTAREVTEVSGRGVGMDVVKSCIDALRGSLDITSNPGQGAAVTLKVPLTLAIIDGLLVRAADAAFVLPVSNILECIEAAPGDFHGANGRQMVSVRDEMVGCIRLRDMFGLGGGNISREHVVIAETSHGKFGFVVDLVIGDHQTVIKPLNGIYRRVQTISGATILGDGSVALILDLDKIVLEALRDERGHSRAA